MNKHFAKKIGAAAAAALATAQVSAADWTTMTAGIDFTGEVTAIQAVTGLIIGVTIVVWGAKRVLRMFG